MTTPSADPADPSHATRVELLGVEFDVVTQQDVLERIAEAIAQGEAPHWIITANLQHVALAHRQESMRAFLRRANTVTADGTPILWLSRLLGRRLPERVTGADLIVPLATRAAREKWSLFLLGGAAGVPQRAGRLLGSLAPGIRIVGAEAPPDVDPASSRIDPAHSALLARIQTARPDILLVAFGAPKQEAWIDSHLHELRARVAIGIGGSLDFLVGAQERAPRWMRAIGLEWLGRIWYAPRRFIPRYWMIACTVLRLLPGALFRTVRPGRCTKADAPAS